MDTPTTEPQSDFYDVLAAAEQRHNTAPKKLRTIQECLDGAVFFNTMFDHGIEQGAITEADIDYDQIRGAITQLDEVTGEKQAKSADRHLLATYVCLMRGLPIPTI